MICTDCPKDTCKLCGKCHTHNCEAEQNCGKQYIKGYNVLKYEKRKTSS